MALDREQEAIGKFKEYVLSLNEQFARWVVSQWDTKPDRFWCTGMVDYLRHAVIIKRDHAEAVAALGAGARLLHSAQPGRAAAGVDARARWRAAGGSRVTKSRVSAQSGMARTSLRTGGTRRSSPSCPCTTPRRAAAPLWEAPAR